MHDLHALLLTLFGPGTWGAGGNIAAAPILAACAALAAYLGRHRIGRVMSAWWGKHHPHRDELAEIRRTAEAARRIAADTYEHHTGRRHPDAPREGGQP